MGGRVKMMEQKRSTIIDIVSYALEMRVKVSHVCL